VLICNTEYDRERPSSYAKAQESDVRGSDCTSSVDRIMASNSQPLYTLVVLQLRSWGKLVGTSASSMNMASTKRFSTLFDFAIAARQ